MSNEKGIYVGVATYLGPVSRGIRFNTSLNKPVKSDTPIAFIPFDNDYTEPMNGGVGYLNLSCDEWDFSKYGLRQGFIQNIFMPFGGFVVDLFPNLLGKRLAEQIEVECAKYLLEICPEDTPIAIGASDDHHKAYCERNGFTPFTQMPLREYICKLEKTISEQTNN